MSLASTDLVVPRLTTGSWVELRHGRVVERALNVVSGAVAYLALVPLVVLSLVMLRAARGDGRPDDR